MDTTREFEMRKGMVQRAYTAGHRAYHDGMMRAPGIHPVIVEFLKDRAVGDPLNIQIMQAFLDGFDQAAEDAALMELS